MLFLQLLLGTVLSDTYAFDFTSKSVRIAYQKIGKPIKILNITKQFPTNHFLSICEHDDIKEETEEFVSLLDLLPLKNYENDHAISVIPFNTTTCVRVRLLSLIKMAGFLNVQTITTDYSLINDFLYDAITKLSSKSSIAIIDIRKHRNEIIYFEHNNSRIQIKFDVFSDNIKEMKNNKMINPDYVYITGTHSTKKGNQKYFTNLFPNSNVIFSRHPKHSILWGALNNVNKFRKYFFKTLNPYETKISTPSSNKTIKINTLKPITNSRLQVSPNSPRILQLQIGSDSQEIQLSEITDDPIQPDSSLMLTFGCSPKYYSFDITKLEVINQTSHGRNHSLNISHSLLDIFYKLEHIEDHQNTINQYFQKKFMQSEHDSKCSDIRSFINSITKAARNDITLAYVTTPQEREEIISNISVEFDCSNSSIEELDQIFNELRQKVHDPCFKFLQELDRPYAVQKLNEMLTKSEEKRKTSTASQTAKEHFDEEFNNAKQMIEEIENMDPLQMPKITVSDIMEQCKRIEEVTNEISARTINIGQGGLSEEMIKKLEKMGIKVSRQVPDENDKGAEEGN